MHLMMDYAAKISSDPGSITPADVDLLQKDGLDDKQITDVALAAVVRNFISYFFDALGAGPDREKLAGNTSISQIASVWLEPGWLWLRM
jgi:hypothetical protein